MNDISRIQAETSILVARPLEAGGSGGSLFIFTTGEFDICG
jgi:hypothetical protein